MSDKLDEALARDLVDTLNAVERTIREDAPSLSELMRDRADSFAFSDVVYPIWNQFEHTVADRSRVARAEVARLTAEVDNLMSSLERNGRLIQGIELSGSAFETPLGPLPVGVRELVFLYPTILGLAYLLCLSSFLRLVSLRKALQSLSKKLDDSELAADPSHIALTMPLWYDPFLPVWRQLGRVILALVPLAFMVWCYLSLRSMSPVISNSDSRFNAQWYEVFLLLTIVAAVMVLVRVIMSLLGSNKAGSTNPGA